MASNRLAYDAGEIKQMAAAVSNQGIHYDAIPGNLLRLVGGVPTTAQLNLPVGVPSRAKFAFACAAALEVTNTGHSAMQVARAGVRLTRSPERNQTSYRLVEACSIQRLDFYCGPQLGGGPVRCAIYTLQVKLESAPAGTEVTGVPMAIDDQTQKVCPLATLEPNQSVEIWLDTYSPVGLVYPVVPILVVNTASGVQTAVLDDLAGNMSFADPSQFTCYRLIGDSFEVWKQGQEAVDWPTLGHQKAWCP